MCVCVPCWHFFKQGPKTPSKAILIIEILKKLGLLVQSRVPKFGKITKLFYRRSWESATPPLVGENRKKYLYGKFYGKITGMIKHN
jgi:hypothetical protein